MTKAKMATEIPAAITMPDSVETRLGTLRFTDGFPDDATVEKVFDNLDFQHAVQAFLTSMPAASQVASRRGVRGFGPDNQTVLIFESLMDSRSLFLTANTESIYAVAWLNLKNGPIVVESPPNTLGLADDLWFRYVTDLGIAGPDKGKGGKFLFLPPDFTGTAPEGYYTFKSPNLRQHLCDARLSGERRSEAGRRRHQAAAADLSAGGRRESAGNELRQRVREGLQHDPCDGCLVLR